MTNRFLRAGRSACKNGIILCLSFLCLLAGIHSGAAAGLTVEKSSFSPATVQMGQNFAFSFNLASAVTLSNVIVDMEVRDASGDLLLQKYNSGQNFGPGQTVSYGWTGTIPVGQTLSVPFAAGGKYNMIIYIYNSNWTAQYNAATVAGTFTVSAAPTAASAVNTVSNANVGNTATAPIQPPAGKGKTYYVSSPANQAIDLANRALLPAGAIIYPTIQAAANVTEPGDTVLVMNGTYEPANPADWVNAVVTINTSGTAAQGYITYAAYPGAHPVVTSSNTENTWDVFQTFGSYIVIRGFEVIGSAKNVTLSEASAASAAEATVLKKQAAAGLPAAYPASTTQNVTNGNCIAGQDVTHVIILNNLVHDCSAAGISFETSDNITIEANTVYNTSWWTIYDTSGISLHETLNSDSSTAYKNFVLDNISYDNANTQPFMYDLYNNDVTPGSAPTYPTDGEGIIIDTNQGTNNGSPYLGRTLVAGNIVYNNGGAGVEVYKSDHVDVINNTGYLNNTCPVAGSVCGPASYNVTGNPTPVSGNYAGQIFSNDGSDINFYNNILYAPAGKYVLTNWGNSYMVENNNLLTSANGQILADYYTPAAHDIIANPLFSDTKAPPNNDFLLSANSPGIDKGISYSNEGVSVPSLLGLKIVNGAVDIGADQ